jgi:hypothetical protein
VVEQRNQLECDQWPLTLKKRSRSKVMVISILWKYEFFITPSQHKVLTMHYMCLNSPINISFYIIQMKIMLFAFKTFKGGKPSNCSRTIRITSFSYCFCSNNTMHIIHAKIPPNLSQSSPFKIDFIVALDLQNVKAYIVWNLHM